MNRFLCVKTSDGYDLIINVNTIKYIERSPNDKEGSVWIWTDWASSGFVSVNEPIEDIQKRLGL